MESDKRFENVRCYSRRKHNKSQEDGIESLSNVKENTEEIPVIVGFETITNGFCSNNLPVRCFVCLEPQDSQDFNENYKVLNISDTIMKYISEKLPPDIIESLKPCSSFNNLYCRKCSEISCDISRLCVKLEEIRHQINAAVLKYVERITKCRKASQSSEDDYSIRIAENIFSEDNENEGLSPMDFVVATYEETHSATSQSKNECGRKFLPDNLPFLPATPKKQEEKSSIRRSMAFSCGKKLPPRQAPESARKKITLSTFGENASQLKVTLERLVTFDCTPCKKSFISKAALDSHKVKEKCLHPFLNCPTCKISFNVPKTRQKLKTGQRSVRCPKCRLCFVTGKISNNISTPLINDTTTKVNLSPRNTRSSKNNKDNLEKNAIKIKPSESAEVISGCETPPLPHETIRRVHIPRRFKKKTKKTDCFQCNKCGKHFLKASSLYSHAKSNSNCYFMQCNVCKIRMSPALLQSHMKLHETDLNAINQQANDSKPEKDHSQDAEDTSETKNVQIQVKEESPTMAPASLLSKLTSLKCMTCKNALQPYKNTGENVAKLQMPGSSPFYCSNCKKVFILAANSEGVKYSIVNPKIIAQEKRNATEGNQYACSKCNGKFASLYILLVHRNLHCNKLKKTCDICKVSFSFIHQLKAHVVSAHKIPSSSVEKVCGLCNEPFINATIHKSACTKTHEKKCDQCSFVTLTEKSLMKHLVTVHRQSMHTSSHFNRS